MNEFKFKLSHPITAEEWNLITDAELEHTNIVEFTTPSGKTVPFQKVKMQFSKATQFLSKQQSVTGEMHRL